MKTVSALLFGIRQNKKRKDMGETEEQVKICKMKGGNAMIHLLNRKELATTFYMKEQAAIRQMLDEHHIEYTMKVVNRNSSGAFNDTRARTGTFGQDMNIAYQYIFYVRKEDYEKGKAVLRGQYK